MSEPKIQLSRDRLERLYDKYNRRRYVHPDPVELLYAYPDRHDREIVALVAACLAYGRVVQILNSVGAVVERLGPSPARRVARVTQHGLTQRMSGVVHRFARGEHIAGLLWAVRTVRRRYGSLENSFSDALASGPGDTVSALPRFAGQLHDAAPRDLGHLLPRPERGSACKRLHLFLRWMVRRDRVDPGGWDRISPEGLIVPLDTHMHRVARLAGLTARRQTDMRTALEITDGFRRYSPGDPVRYDFALTRIGIRGDVEFRELIEQG